MNKKILYFFIIFLIFGLTFTAGSAVKLVEHNNSSLIIEVQINNTDVGAFSFSLSFDPKETRVVNISGEEPFIIVSNLQDGMVKISGFHGQIPGPSGNVRLVVVTFNGSSEFRIEELKVYNTRGELVEFIPSSEVRITAEDNEYLTPTLASEQFSGSDKMTPSPIEEKPTTIPPDTETTQSHIPETEKTEEIKEDEKQELTPTVTLTQTGSNMPKKELLEIPGFSVLSSLFAVLIVCILSIVCKERGRRKS